VQTPKRILQVCVRFAKISEADSHEDNHESTKA